MFVVYALVLAAGVLAFLFFLFSLAGRRHRFQYWKKDALPVLSHLLAKYRELGYEGLAMALETDMLPCIRLRHASPGSTLWSKLGGLPDLPPDVAWPRYNGKSLSFVAQLDLSEIPETPLTTLLPDSGVLYFFYDQEQYAWGFDPKHKEGWAVIFKESSSDDLFEADAPDDLSLQFDEVPVELVTGSSLPDLEGYAPVEALDKQQRDQIWDINYEYALLNRGPGHQLFGHPDPVQGGGMDLQCQLASHGIDIEGADWYKTPQALELAPGASNWRLLFQVDSDDEACMMWGDAGTLYFWIREDDLRHRQFQNAWMILQCF